MSASIIQRKAAFAQQTGSGTVAVTLDNVIGSNSVIVIACAVIQTDGSSSASPVITVQDDLTNGYSPALSTAGNSYFANTYQGVAVPQAGARTYTLSYTAQAGGSGYSYLAGICVYELSAVSYIGNGSANEELASAHKISDYTATISGLSGGTYGNFLASVGAFLFTSNLTDANQTLAGSGWTLDGHDAASLTYSPVAIVFESQLVGPASNPAGTFTGSGSTTAIDGIILVAAYSLTAAISGGGPVSTNTFLGSVRVLGSAPAGAPTPFVGTMKVVGSVPSGAANPYLGSVVQGTPVAGEANPVLGEVVIVSNVPAGDTDEFLGVIEEGS